MWNWTIATLEIPDDAVLVKPVVPGSHGKMRVASAKVVGLDYYTTDDPVRAAFCLASAAENKPTPYYCSSYNGMAYRLGEIVEAPLDTDINKICASGIYCFATREEAEKYWFT